MLATTDTGTYEVGLNEVQTENSDELLEETISAVHELLTISDLASSEENINSLKKTWQQLATSSLLQETCNIEFPRICRSSPIRLGTDWEHVKPCGDKLDTWNRGN